MSNAVFSEESKADSEDQVTYPRSYSKFLADFQRTGYGLDTTLQEETGQRGEQEEQGCVLGLQRVTSCSAAMERDTPKSAHRNHRAPDQELKPG